ncbi:MAG: elongation factor G [Phycisphaerae bacterium]|jgi:elongation factor G|nr:elongation factor G [Phycisphaerae bacterium]
MPASKAEDIRNLVLLGHGGSGKTTLGEAMLHLAKVTTRLGSVDDGTSHLDYSDIEKDRKHSIDPAMAYFDHAGTTINIIDAPGYPDFIGGAISASGGADIAVIVISAPAGIEVNTRRMFKLAQTNKMPIAIIVNKIDAENVDNESLLAQITETFGQACKPMNLPANGNTAVIDCFANDQGESDLGDVADARTELIDNIVEADEELMEAYLGDEELTAAQLSSAMSKAMVEGTVAPILFTSAKADIGVTDALDAIAKYFPSPADCTHRPVMIGDDEEAEEVEVSADPAKPLIAQAFKVTTDPFVGKLAWIRILQGSVTPEATYYLGDAKKAAKVGHLYKVLGKDSKDVKSAVAGDIIALAKVEEITPGAALHDQQGPMCCSIPDAPTPMFSLAVTPKKRGDEQKISEALTKLSQEDPTFAYARDNQTHETVISGIGDLHLRILLIKMKERFDLEVETKPPKIPYKETITGKADGHHRHKKQTGGSGQFGEVYLRVEPMERGEGFDFVNDLFGESIPRQYLPAIEKGVKDVLVNGAVAGYPMQDIRVSVYDGKHHPVDSKEVAFRAAGKWAFIDAVNKARPAILEPIVDMEISVPADFMGDIASDLSGRRGRIIGQDMLPGNQVVVKAQAPLSEVMQYNSQLRSVTGGQGSYTMELSHYEPVPGNVQQQLVAAMQKAKEEDK